MVAATLAEAGHGPRREAWPRGVFNGGIVSPDDPSRRCSYALAKLMAEMRWMLKLDVGLQRFVQPGSEELYWLQWQKWFDVV